MYLKIMAGDGVPDDDSRATFTMHDNVATVEFGRPKDGPPRAHVTFYDDHAEHYELDGNCYLMNEEGDTIASFGVMPYVKPKADHGV